MTIDSRDRVAEIIRDTVEVAPMIDMEGNEFFIINGGQSLMKQDYDIFYEGKLYAFSNVQAWIYKTYILQVLEFHKDKPRELSYHPVQAYLSERKVHYSVWK